MPRGRRSPRPERARTARGVLWVAVFAFVAVIVRHDRAQLRRLLERVHISEIISAHIVSIAGAAFVALAGIWVVATVFHAVAWVRAARQERWLLDDRRAMSVPPLGRHLQVLPERIGVVTSAVFAVAGVALLGVYAALPSHPDPAVTLGVIMTAGGILSFADARRERRAITLSNAGLDERPLPPAAPSPAARSRPDQGPPLRFEIFESAPDDAPPQCRPSETQNAFGRPPWTLVYLRVFANERRLLGVLTSPWREFGYIHYIRAAGSVTNAELQFAEAGGPVFVRSPPELELELARQARHTALEPPPSRRRFRPPPRNPARLLFPVRTLLCSTAFWQVALDRLLAAADIALLDLSGYQQANVGTAYELQRLIDTFPMRRCVVLLDERSDLLFVKAHIGHAWQRMGPTSPNGVAGHGVVRFVVIPELPGDARGRRGDSSVNDYSPWQLTRSRAQYLRLGRLLQDVVDGS